MRCLSLSGVSRYGTLACESVAKCRWGREVIGGLCLALGLRDPGAAGLSMMKWDMSLDSSLEWLALLWFLLSFDGFEICHVEISMSGSGFVFRCQLKC